MENRKCLHSPNEGKMHCVCCRESEVCILYEQFQSTQWLLQNIVGWYILSAMHFNFINIDAFSSYSLRVSHQFSRWTIHSFYHTFCALFACSLKASFHSTTHWHNPFKIYEFISCIRSLIIYDISEIISTINKITKLADDK